MLELDTSAFPRPETARSEEHTMLSRGKRAVAVLRAARDLSCSWGIGRRAYEPGQHLLDGLTGNHLLEDADPPVAVSTTDLITGNRYIIRTGPASEAVYASAALAGVLPPLKRDDRLLADGAYADLAPIDVARAFGHPVVIVVDPGQVFRYTC